jgi:hypothetical protein
VKNRLAEVESKQIASLPGLVSIERLESGCADSRYLGGVGKPDLLDLRILAGAATGSQYREREEDCDEA